VSRQASVLKEIRNLQAKVTEFVQDDSLSQLILLPK